MSEKILLVDGHSIANRAFYGVPLLTNSKGVYTNALHGFFNILWKVIEQEKPDYLGIAFDLKTPTFRHKMYSEYKGTRAGMPEELRQQIPLLQDLLGKAGVVMLTKEGYEADDVLGTIGKSYSAQNTEVTILSGDRDLLQLVDENIKLLIPKTKKGGTEMEEYHVTDVVEKYGVEPAGYLQMKALMGDPSDNIPGVPAIGEKTAAKIIQTFGTVENAIANVNEVKPPRASKNLEEFQEQARLSLTLATICTDCPEPGEAGKLTEQTFATQQFVEGLKEYELKSLLQRVLPKVKANQVAEKSIADVEKAAATVAEEKESDQLSLDDMIYEEPVKPAANGETTSIEELAENLKGHEGPLTLAICGEEGDVCGMAVDQWYVDGSLNDIIPIITPLLEDESVTKITFDVKKLYKELQSRRVEMKGEVIDALLAAYLLNPSKDDYAPDELATIYLDEYVPSEAEILGTGVKKLRWSQVEPAVRADYMTTVTRILSRVAQPMMQELEVKGMKMLYDVIERPLAEVLASMELAGIAVDLSVLDSFGSFLTGEIDKLQQEIYDLAGETFNINSTKQLGVILFEKLGLKAGKKTKSGYSTSAEVLEKLKWDSPIVAKVLMYRQLTKLQSTYVEGLKGFVVDGKIHSKFKQAVTATGRLSSTDPNLQNIPIRMDLGRQLRKAFVPSGLDWFFMDADYSQIELRLLAHMSGDEKMIAAYQSGADIHRMTASQVMNIPFDEVTPAQRSSAKAVNFGIIYGMSAFSLSDDLGITTKEAAEYIEKYFAQYPSVKDFLDGCVASAKEKGYGETLFGRRRNIEELKASNFNQRSFGERVAKNMPIQGSAADIIKIAMIRVYQRMKEEGLKSRLIVQVHDELLIEVYRPEAERVRVILEEEMQGAMQLKVPLTIDIHTGENWYEAK